MEFNVKKRNGKLVPFDADKINETLEWAAEGLTNVSPSQVALAAKIQFFDGIESSVIQELLIKSAANLISVDNPDYQYYAGRLLMFDLRKRVFGQYEPDDFYEHILSLVALGKYDGNLITKWSEAEINELGEYIDHNYDLNYTYAAMIEWEGKYLVKDRTTKQHFESPQQAIMLIGMCLHEDEPKDERMQYVKDFYDVIANGDSLPTPIMAGVRTPTRQFSSCVLIESGDSLDSINASSSAIVKYVSQRAGIGINAGRIRALGSSIRNGEALHTGCIPFYKHFQTAVKSCSQGGVRGGAATLFYPFWHLEVENLLVLKNNKGTEDNRVRHLDYAVQFSRVAYERLISKGDITLFCPDAVPELYDAFYGPADVFKEMYERLEKDPLIRRKKVIKAEDFWTLFANERSSTGRIYLQNVDHCNTNSPFDYKKAPIRQSNLCVAPETKILTSNGYEVISELEGEKVTVWNGQEWSETVVAKTGENQKLLTVKTNAGFELVCTPYHKFYIACRHPTSGNRWVIEKRANELKSGDKLIKSDFPVILGSETLLHPYANGFYSGDGCLTKQGKRIYLYGEKRKLKNHLGDIFHNWKVQDAQDREYGHSHLLKDKFFVPSSDYDVESRIKWFEGLCDSDGTVARNGNTQSIQVGSIEQGFLQEVQMMLQTLGVSSKVTASTEAGDRLMPLNDGSGELGMFRCQQAYRLLIGQTGINNLQALGFNPKRISLTNHKPNRECSQFVKITEVVDEGRYDDTYCFTESKRGMGVFNGILTGQCLEIALPTKHFEDVKGDDGEIALCTLAAFNLANTKHLLTRARVLVRALDNLLDYQDYPVKAALKNKKRRTLGVGVINYAYWLAKKGLKYSDGSANDATHRLFEEIQYSLLVASNELAEEKGMCEWFGDTTYSKGVLPIDRYNKGLDSVGSFEYKQDWEALRERIRLYGLRNSTLSALMPSETSSKISNATNGIEPIRGLVVIKANKEGRVKQVAPDCQVLKDKYEIVWDGKINKGYITLVAIMQKFIDQTISANTNYDPRNYAGRKVPITEVLQDLVTGYKLGVKTFYYHNTRDGAGEDVDDDGCESGACKI